MNKQKVITSIFNIIFTAVFLLIGWLYERVSNIHWLQTMQQDRSLKIVANWIFIGVVMLIIQVLLGGITRLTGSGLSITEWKPIMGALPPMNEIEWMQSFAKYQQTGQYQYLNQHFTLEDFKFIFFWEWMHRLWARLIGVAFIIPFIFFLVKKYFKSRMIIPLVILFLLGALQGAIGWIMVQSGLNTNDVYVSHFRLAIHFMAAMGLICYALVFGLKIFLQPSQRIVHPQLFKGALVITILICIQLIFGAFMSGLKAAAAAPTWPDINGEIIPAALSGRNFLMQALHDKIAIHFIHRNLAYIITICIIVWWLKARNISHSSFFNKAKNLVFIIVIIQVCLGVFTVLNSPKISAGKFGVFEWIAVTHQLTGMLLLLAMVGIVVVCGKNKHPMEL